MAVGLGILLRVWGVGGQDLSFDEAFTATASRRPLGDLFSFLRHNDTHPPLDYLLRAPFARATSELAVRLPSVLFSVAALLLIAWWMRSKGTFGAFTTIAASVMPFLVGHGREARMYSLVILLGVGAAICAERWLESASTQRAVAITGLGLAAMFSHSAAIPAVACLTLLPGLRRDRAAWILRGALLAAFLVWAALWGPAFLDQSAATRSGNYWLPTNSPEWFEIVTAALITPTLRLRHLALAGLIAGVACLLARRDLVSRVAVLSFVAPFVALALAGIELRVFIPRTFAFGAWVVAAAIGAGIERLRCSPAGERGAFVGVILLLAVVLPPSVDHARVGPEERMEMDVLRNRLEPGDRISIAPAWFRPLVEWNFVAQGDFAVVGESGGRFVVEDRSAAPSGRLHLLDLVELPLDEVEDGLGPCEPDFSGPHWVVRCVRLR